LVAVQVLLWVHMTKESWRVFCAFFHCAVALNNEEAQSSKSNFYYSTVRMVFRSAARLVDENAGAISRTTGYQNHYGARKL
jgi:hypothetical protein